MPAKIDNRATIKLPSKTEQILQNAFELIPKEHLRGLNRIVLVDYVSPVQRMQIPNLQQMPGLYHPKVGSEHPYFEIAMKVLLPAEDTFIKRMAAKLNYKANLVSLLFSLQAQHFHLNMSHGVKKHQAENAVRSYMEKYFTLWQQQNAGWRAKAFKPLQPLIQKWAKKLKTKYDEEQRKSRKS